MPISKSNFSSFWFKRKIFQQNSARGRIAFQPVLLLVVCIVVILIGSVIISGKWAQPENDIAANSDIQLSKNRAAQQTNTKFSFDNQTVDSTPQKRQGQPEDDIRQIFDAVARANLKKDIGLFKTVYSSKFSGWDQKKKKTMDMWQQYDFLCLDYYIVDIDIRGSAAKVFIVWEIALENIQDGNQLVLETNNRATLEKGMDGWEIIETN